MALFRLPMWRDLAYELGRGLDFLHSRLRLMHTDLKPENVLSLECNFTPANHAGAPLRLKICDLGGCTEETAREVRDRIHPTLQGSGSYFRSRLDVSRGYVERRVHPSRNADRETALRDP